MYKFFLGILFFGLWTQNVFAQTNTDPALDTEQVLNAPILPPAVEPYDEEYEAVADEEYDQQYNEEEKEWDLRQVDTKEWQKLKNEKRFQYKKKKKKKVKDKKSSKPWFEGIGAFFSSTFFKLLLYLFLGAFLIYIVYLFIKNNNISFRKNIKDEEIVQEDPWEDVTSFEDWELALQKALAEKDYRLATRIYYLHTLHILDKNGFLHYREDKTNWYYVQKLYGTARHDDFKELTRSFDYIWYGEYQIGEEQFELLATQFVNFKIQIS